MTSHCKDCKHHVPREHFCRRFECYVEDMGPNWDCGAHFSPKREV